MHNKLQIIYELNKPYGIRDSSGYLFLFTKIDKYSGQEERYRQEVEEQYKLADFLLNALRGRTAGNVEPVAEQTHNSAMVPCCVCKEPVIINTKHYHCQKCFDKLTGAQHQ
jgi:hypothetical protein